jgi:hypothetical protein
MEIDKIPGINSPIVTREDNILRSVAIDSFDSFDSLDLI